MDVVTHTTSKGSTLIPLAVQLKRRDTAGVLQVVNLTGLTVKFYMVDNHGDEVIAETDTGVLVTDAINGKVQYDFSAAGVATVGCFWGRFKTYNAAGDEYDAFPYEGRKYKIVITASEG